jgi:hypothetical protein
LIRTHQTQSQCSIGQGKSNLATPDSPGLGLF